MKMKNNIEKIARIVNNTLILGMVMMLPIWTLSAQPELPEAPNDAAPIDYYMFIAIAIGIYFAYRFFKTKHIIETKN